MPALTTKKLHWTQRPENRAKLSRLSSARRRKRLKKATAPPEAPRTITTSELMALGKLLDDQIQIMRGEIDRFVALRNKLP